MDRPLPRTEFEIDRRMHALAGLMVVGTDTPRDRTEYFELQAMRSRRMSPEPISPRIRGLASRRRGV